MAWNCLQGHYSPLWGTLGTNPNQVLRNLKIGNQGRFVVCFLAKRPISNAFMHLSLLMTLIYCYRYGGTIYAFLFSSDIINNLMVAALSKEIKQRFGYLGLFTIISAWGLLSLLATLLYPKNPSPSKKKLQKLEQKPVTSTASSSAEQCIYPQRAYHIFHSFCHISFTLFYHDSKYSIFDLLFVIPFLVPIYNINSILFIRTRLKIC